MEHPSVRAMTFLAHTENASGIPHLLRDHLRYVGKLARYFAEKGFPALNEVAEWAGLLHDLGKYREEFQDYLRKKRESSSETHHAVYGAALGARCGSDGLVFAIAGHHAGLHDLNELQNQVGGSKYQAEQRVPLLLARFEQELQKVPELIADPEFIENSPHSREFYIRMLFSLLIDADRLDTEAHGSGFCRLPPRLDAPGLLQRLIAEKERKPSEGELNALRNRIFQRCLDQAQQEPGFFSLTVPTGGGKTLSGMAFALAHAAQHQLRRVIVVIPYLSIIEQNAAQYRQILDPDNRGIVIEHHSAVSVREDPDETRPASPFEKHPAEYAVENWDAPVIVTTSVQFIETLFASRTSRCRKLHNIARAVVIFDEVQTLPSHLLNPLLNVFRELRTNYGSSFVFSTATQPAFRYRPLSLAEGFGPDEITPIIEETEAKQIFKGLNRVSIRLPQRGESLGWSELADGMDKHPQSLCVVNVRRHAFELWEKLRNTVFAEEKGSVFHLSSAMCAEHRLAILGEVREPAPGTIRRRLANGEACRLVSTQLIEAGVDVDFPIVWRSLAPLDSIVQAAGRCNRENRLKDKAGNPKRGEVIVFRPEKHTLPPGVYGTATGLTEPLLERLEGDELTNNPALFAHYFDKLYESVQTDGKAIQNKREKLHFRTVAGLARVIEDDTNAVIVPYGKAVPIIQDIRSRTVEKGKPRIDRDDLRKLQRFMVNLHSRDFNRLLQLKAIRPLLPNLDISVLEEGWYHADLGILIDQRPMEDYLL